MPDNTPVCRRCGRCCELGGPGLLRDDAPLLSSGALRPEMLVCLRRGQWARQDGMGGGLAQLENEMLKLAGTGKAPHPWQCLAYAPGTGCTIYDRRPVQCGVLFCEDTRPLEALLRDVPALDRRAAIALLPLGASQWSWPGLVWAFALFRLFDIWKPWPVHASENWLPAGWGIMLDDILAGLMAMCCMLVLRALGWV